MVRLLVGSSTVIALLAAGAAGAATVEWDVSLWGERRASTEHVHKLAELVEERTNGELILDIRYNDLSKSTETLDGLAIGAFEMAQFCSGYHADKNPALTVLELPFLGVDSLEEAAAVSDAVYAHPAAQEDLARWNAKVLMSTPVPPHNLVGTGAPRASLEAFGEMRVRAVGGLAEVFEAAGAVPTAVTAPETYEAMQSGIVDAVAFPPDAHLFYRTLDLADWWTVNLDLGTVNCPVAVNLDAYQALDPEHREALDGSLDEALEHYVANYQALMTDWDDTLERRGVMRVTVPETELAKFRDLSASIRDRWIERTTAQGLPAEELYDLVRTTLEQHGSPG